MDIWFNTSGNVTHSLRLRPIDSKPGEITVWEALTDGNAYTFFEASIDPSAGGTEAWELIELAIQAYLDYSNNDEVAKTRWVE